MTDWNWPNAILAKITDGDSFSAILSKDIGFHILITSQQKLRLNRINAPKGNTPNGQVTTQRVTQLLQGNLNITTVGPYKYGDEWMAEVVNAQGQNVSDQLVKENLAAYWSGQGPKPDDN